MRRASVRAHYKARNLIMGMHAQVLEPKGDKSVATRDWDKMGSDISELGLWDDDEQPLPTNVM